MPYFNSIKFKSVTIPFAKIQKLGTSSAVSPVNNLSKISSKTTKVEPKNLEVSRTYKNVEYTWSSDFSSCSASAVQNGTNANISENGTVELVKTIQPTHEEDGNITYVAKFTKKPFDIQFKIKTLPAVGHDYNTPTYTWNEEGTVCTAKRTCKDDDVFEEEVGTMTYTVEDATCTENGRKIATATFVNTAFSTQTNDYEIIPSLGGHVYGAPTYVWNEDGQSCTATRVCQNDSDHKEIENGTITSSVKVAVACTTDGTTTYTATFSNSAFATQTKDITDVPALGHNIVNHVCTRCGYTEYVPGLYDSTGNQLSDLTVAQVEQDSAGCIIPASWIA